MVIIIIIIVTIIVIIMVIIIIKIIELLIVVLFIGLTRALHHIHVSPQCIPVLCSFSGVSFTQTNLTGAGIVWDLTWRTHFAN